MSLPVGHGLAGLAICLAVREKGKTIAWHEAALALFLPVLPDIDFLIEWFAHVDAVVCRRTFTHSLPTALLAGAGLAYLGVGWRDWPRRANGVYLGSLFFCHGIIDFFGGPNPRPPSGVAFLSPFISKRWAFPIAVLPSVPIPVRRPGILWEFWPSFFMTGVHEALYFAPLLAWLWYLRKRTIAAAMPGELVGDV